VAFLDSVESLHSILDLLHSQDTVIDGVMAR
jgi:hypothetical protein